MTTLTAPQEVLDDEALSHEAPDFVLLNDQPVGESSNQDILGTADAAARIADLIIASRHLAPFTLGIDASWGMGKSSLMHQVKIKLEEKNQKNRGEKSGKSRSNEVELVWFNAWTSEGASALEGLIKSVLAQLDENYLRRALRKMVGRRQLLRLLWITILIAASFLRLSQVVDELWRQFSFDARSRNEIRSELTEIFKAWSKPSKRSQNGRMLVVFIDDLDRCFHESILEICEALKLYLDVPGIVFVLACDQNTLAKAATKATSQGVRNLEYMEKIVQVTYRKPAPDDSQLIRFVTHCAEKSGTSSLLTESEKKIVIDRTNHNPRQIKRLINSFILEYQLSPEWQTFGAESLIRVILLQHFYPEFYRDMTKAATKDIFNDFRTYTRLRSEVRSDVPLGRVLSDSDREFFERHSVRPPAPDDDAMAVLHQLEEELPVEFPRMVKDTEFSSLVQGLVEGLPNAPNTNMLRDLLDFLQSHKLATAPTRELIGDAAGQSAMDPSPYRGLHILWIDDNPAWIKDKADILMAEGAQVTTATDLQSARAMLRRMPHPDVIISDINRANDENRGLKDMQILRSDRTYLGPALFYTSRVTPSRQRSAADLDASITSSRDGLADFLTRIQKKKTGEKRSNASD